ncbi:hypothetical protein [Butyrivibrio sp. AC2005]|uniref:hypothetical protein n=1 Tax=Butyrivibrio sp. AC2005 TaxID=1280672 RepID=UPI00047B90D6|nr:hypothetical protein [Butyrivibrio sp. AC2005]
MSIRGYCTFAKNLYIGESVKKPLVVKWKLKHGAGQLFIYVLTASDIPDGQIEIKHCAFLKQKYYLRHPAYIYGIAGSYKEALDLVLKMFEEASESGLTGDIRTYLEKAVGDN